MSAPNPPVRPVVFGAGDHRPRLLRWLPRGRRLLLAIVLVVLLAACLSYLIIETRHKADLERAAVTQSEQKAKGFSTKSKGYSFTQLNSAIDYAYDGKCTEARAVYDDAAAHPNGLRPTDLQAYKKRIDAICSASPAPAPKPAN